MIDLGFFREDEHLELLSGALVRMSPQGNAHASVVVRLTELFVLAFHGRAETRPQVPLALSSDSEPEPDLALAKLTRRPPGKPRSALLVVEVAGSTLSFDRTTKARLYAKARIPEYWVINLAQAQVEVHRRPQKGQYAQRIVVSRGESLEVRALPGPKFRVDDIFGGA